MSIEEVAKYVSITTYTNNSTEIIFKNGTRLIGYFDGNTKGSALMLENKWNFVIDKQPLNTHHQTTLDGNEFEKIFI